jgi:hypothetical protein
MLTLKLPPLAEGVPLAGLNVNVQGACAFIFVGARQIRNADKIAEPNIDRKSTQFSLTYCNPIVSQELFIIL